MSSSTSPRNRCWEGGNTAKMVPTVQGNGAESGLKTVLSRFISRKPFVPQPKRQLKRGIIFASFSPSQHCFLGEVDLGQQSVRSPSLDSSSAAEPPSWMKPKPWVERVRQFTPSWFAASMGVGVQTSLLHGFPYPGGHQSVLDGFATAFLILNIALFLILCFFSALRIFKFRGSWSAIVRDSTQSHYLGCCPCALSTIINGLVFEAYQKYRIGGPGFLYFVWTLWWINLGMALLSGFGLLRFMIVHHTYTYQSPSAIWLLPFIPIIVVGATGTVVATAMVTVSTHYAFFMTLISVSCIIAGVTMSIFILAIYTLRLIIYGFPSSALAMSVLIPIGPFGQGGWGLLYTSDLFTRLLPGATSHNDWLSASGVGTSLATGCVVTAAVFWLSGLWFLVPAVVQLVYSTRIPFSVSWWALIFPLGVYSLLTVALGNKINSGPLRCLGAIFSLLTFAAFVVVAGRTLAIFYSEMMGYSPEDGDGRSGEPRSNAPHSHEDVESGVAN